QAADYLGYEIRRDAFNAFRSLGHRRRPSLNSLFQGVIGTQYINATKLDEMIAWLESQTMALARQDYQVMAYMQSNQPERTTEYGWDGSIFEVSLEELGISELSA